MRNLLLLSGALLLGALTLSAQTTRPAGQKPAPFGGRGDVAFAEKLWKAMDGYTGWKLRTGVIRGASPHGKLVRMYSTWVTVDGHAYPTVVKDNYGGRGMTPEKVEENPAAYLKSVTVMLQREPGYDPENQNWFWVKFDPDGKVAKNEKGMALAGRVAKGMSKGCISCHSQAEGGDYLFSND